MELWFGCLAVWWRIIRFGRKPETSSKAISAAVLCGRRREALGCLVMGVRGWGLSSEAKCGRPGRMQTTLKLE